MIKKIFFSLISLSSFFTQAQQSVTFNYTGSLQTWTVPPCVYNIQVDVRGAKGGGIQATPFVGSGQGGNGARVQHPSIAVTPGQVLEIRVGGNPTGPAGGWNGGGNGHAAPSNTQYESKGGGGASDIRVTPYAMNNRIVVAGGGGGRAGGSGQTNYQATGGQGGCATGQTGTGSPFTGTGGGGGTQVAGGNGGPPWGGGQPGFAGSIGQGGNGGFYSTAAGGGGGGGYYGGGGGGGDNCCATANGGGGGGGGSSFYPAGGTCTQGFQTGNGQVVITYTAGSTIVTASNTGPYCAGAQISISAATGSPTYAWTGPNGFTSNLQNPTIPNATAAMAGVYTVTYDAGGCISTATTTVVVNTPVVPTFNQIAPICEDAIVTATLTTMSTNVPAIQGTWNPAVINTANSGTTTYTFSPNQGICATQATMNIQILPNEQSTFNQIADLCINGVAPALPATSTNNIPYTGVWSPATISTTNAGTFTFTFTPTAGQCAFPATMDIVVHALTTPQFNPMGQICQYMTNVVIPTTATNTSSYLNGPLITGAWNNPTVITTTPGTVNYTFTPNPNQCASTLTFPITVDPLIVPQFTQIPQLCQDDANPIFPTTSNNVPGITGTWTPPNIDTSIPGILTHTFFPDPGQCGDTVDMTITIVPAVPPAFVADTLSGCNPLLVNLSTIGAVQGAVYTWYWGGTQIGQGSNFSYTFDASGYHDITLEYNLLGCIETTTYNDYIYMESYPEASFAALPGALTESTMPIQFVNNSVGAITYVWDFDDNTTSTEENPNHMYVGVSENLLVTLTAYTSLGCSDEYQLNLPVIAEPIYYVPNTFTPDEDEHNQTWQAIFTTGFDPFAFQLAVFNRWGEVIWETNDATQAWDGTYGQDGIKVPAGVYTWKLQFETKENDYRKIVTGHLNLIR